jgi:menaquinone-9 beta-reductase
MAVKTISKSREVQIIDLIIIGAGPAGISTALHLLELDPSWQKRMLVLEKHTHPRPKLCGGGMTTFGLKILQELGIELPLPVSQARVVDIRLNYQNRTVHGRGSPVFLVYRRDELDALLAKEARQRGVTIYEEEAVQHIEVTNEGVLVETNKSCYLAQVVVGADGSKGIVRRKVAGEKKQSRTGRTLEIIYPASEDSALFIEEYAFIDFDPVQSALQGYAWVFPSRIRGKPFYNIGVYDSGFFKKKNKAYLPDILKGMAGSQNVNLQSCTVEGHPIHWFHPANRLSAPRLLLVGDAAGADPLLGEGIAPALGYGQVAAMTIRDAFNKRDFSFKDYRRRILFSPLGRYLLVRWYIAWWSYRLCHQNWFMHTLWSACMIASIILPKPKITETPYPGLKKEKEQIE